MKAKRSNKVLSLYACRKLLPVFSTGKYVIFLGAIFFQQIETVHLFFACIMLMMMFLTADTYLKVNVWKCRKCSKQLPHDFYSRKTMDTCPACGAKLNFSHKQFFIPAEDMGYCGEDESNCKITCL